MDRKEAEEKMKKIDPTGTMDERVLQDNPDIRAALLPVNQENVIAVLDDLWKKNKEKHSSIPDGDVEGMTYYDGMRAGLAWAELELTRRMNDITLDRMTDKVEQ